MILVTGATGLNGLAVVRGLVAAGQKVSALVRDVERAKTLLPPEVAIKAGDLDQEATLPDALVGVDVVFLLTLSGPDQPRQEQRFLDAAKRARISHVVRMSTAGADPVAASLLMRNHGICDRMLEMSGMPHVVIRPNVFMQTFARSAREIAAAGFVSAPMDSARCAFIDTRDIAAVAVRLLVEAREHRDVHVLTGPESLTHADVAGKLSKAAGRTIAFKNISLAQMRQKILEAGAPLWRADLVAGFYEQIRKGVLDRPMDTVQSILGRPPTTFDNFARDHADQFRHA